MSNSLATYCILAASIVWLTWTKCITLRCQISSFSLFISSKDKTVVYLKLNMKKREKNKEIPYTSVTIGIKQ